MYNKLFTKILDSTVWLEDDATRLVWITFLAVMDEDGFVGLSAVGNVAARARVSIEDADAALKILEAPDKADPSQEHDGRRIERVPYGWMVLNAIKYRDIIKRETAKEQTRARVAKYRNTLKVTMSNADVTQSNEKVTPSVAVSVSDTKKKDIVGQEPDGAPPKVNGSKAEALEVLAFLNEKTGRNYEPLPANLDLIKARLKDGATVLDCRQVIAKKCREWIGDEKMALYLRPKTLFSRTNFAQYKGELVD